MDKLKPTQDGGFFIFKKIIISCHNKEMNQGRKTDGFKRTN
jgi:hypothetical protein